MGTWCPALLFPSKEKQTPLAKVSFGKSTDKPAVIVDSGVPARLLPGVAVLLHLVPVIAWCSRRWGSMEKSLSSVRAGRRPEVAIIVHPAHREISFRLAHLLSLLSTTLDLPHLLCCPWLQDLRHNWFICWGCVPICRKGLGLDLYSILVASFVYGIPSCHWIIL
jgi:hypothetical protein